MLQVCTTYTDTSVWPTTPLADSGINDRLVKLCPFIDVSYFAAVNNKIPKKNLLNV